MTNSPSTISARHCDDPHHCTTCSDEAEPMRVERIDRDARLGICLDASGRYHEVLLDLVPAAEVGGGVLVHAGVALQAIAPDHARTS